MSASKFGDTPATQLVSYLELAAAQVGDMRTKLDLLRAQVLQATDEYGVVQAHVDSSLSAGAGPNAHVPQGWNAIPNGDWRSAIILYPMATLTAAYQSGKFSNTLNLPDWMWEGDSGLCSALQMMPTVMPIFGDRKFKLWSIQNDTAGVVWGVVPVFFSKRMLYQAWSTYSGK